MLIDSHCHIHEANYPLNKDEVLKRAFDADVRKIICVGSSNENSKEAVEFAEKHANVFASAGVHPHNAISGCKDIQKYLGKIIAIGEIGLDYYYNNSPRDVQIKVLEEQLDLALKNNLPIIFHVREAYDDFWPVLNNFRGIRGVIHCFTDTEKNAEKALSEGFYLGVNGISTFTKDPLQQELYKNIPLNRLLLETDAPYLTPAPIRGRINEPAYVRCIAEFNAERRGISLDAIAKTTTKNVEKLFSI